MLRQTKRIARAEVTHFDREASRLATEGRTEGCRSSGGELEVNRISRRQWKILQISQQTATIVAVIHRQGHGLLETLLVPGSDGGSTEG